MVKRICLFGNAAAGSLAAVGALLLLAACSEAKGLLERLGLPESATDISPIDVDGPGGNMPEIAGRSFIAGESFTVADITAVTAFDLGRVARIRIPEALANLTKWYAAVSARPSVVSTSPARKSA